MGDRTSVTLTVLNEQADEAETFFGGYETDHVSNDNVFTHFSFYEVNYGILTFLDDLQKQGIAFDSSWDSGGDYGPGTDYCRFLSDGSVWRDDIGDDQVNPKLAECMKLIGNLGALKDYIVKHYNDVTPPSWEHQIEYGKLYRTLSLIET